MTTRANPVLWRLAKWLYDNFYLVQGPSSIWENDSTRNGYYDKAAVLYGKIIHNEFTGKDDDPD